MNFQTCYVQGHQHPIQVPDTALARLVADEILSGNAYPPLPHVRRPKTIVDIGANIGLAAIHFHITYPSAKIHCFEPAPDAFDLLHRNTKSIKQIRRYPFALGHIPGARPSKRANLFLGNLDSVQSSLHKSDATSSLSIPIDIRRASSSLKPKLPIDILKVDTEGHEASIFHSIKTFVRYINVIYLESHSNQLFEKCYRIISPSHFLFHATKSHQEHGNWVFVHKRSHKALCREQKKKQAEDAENAKNASERILGDS